MHSCIHQDLLELLCVCLCHIQTIMVQLTPLMQRSELSCVSDSERVRHSSRFRLAVVSLCCSPTESPCTRSKTASREPPHSKCGNSWWKTSSSTSPAKSNEEMNRRKSKARDENAEESRETAILARTVSKSLVSVSTRARADLKISYWRGQQGFRVPVCLMFCNVFRKQK